MSYLFNLIRAVIFFTMGVATTIFFTPFVVGFGLLGWLMPRAIGRSPAYYFTRCYTLAIVAFAKFVCGIRYTVNGLENIPKGRPVVIMARHESAWETLFLVNALPPQTWIIKRELLFVPLIGQCLHTLKAIAINRKAGTTARQQVVEQGTERLRVGLCVTVFPEGTRLAPGETRRYGLGGGLLAVAAGAPILPVAHNAGECWPRNAFVKSPGEIRVVVGPAIECAGRDAASVTEEAQAWVDAMQMQITSPQYKLNRTRVTNVLA
jgi:1-acyl-sn-glycerol-3-phosphate acyltransferase